MPELPEVETTIQGLRPLIQNAVINHVDVRCRSLRWPIASSFEQDVSHQAIHAVYRRGKYLLFQLDHGTLIIHLGMSGRLCLLTQVEAIEKHDHVDFFLSDHRVLRYTDPRRFGAILWTSSPVESHRLIKHLGVEPLDNHFTASYVLQKAKHRHRTVKSFIMDGQIVVGVGNIYAAEALFLARIHPETSVANLTLVMADALVQAIKHVLSSAITQGGTTLKDFVNSEGKPGYFSQKLNVYGRKGLPCNVCGYLLASKVIGQRSTVFCEHCQPRC